MNVLDISGIIEIYNRLEKMDTITTDINTIFAFCETGQIGDTGEIIELLTNSIQTIMNLISSSTGVIELHKLLGSRGDDEIMTFIDGLVWAVNCVENDIGLNFFDFSIIDPTFVEEFFNYITQSNLYTLINMGFQVPNDNTEIIRKLLQREDDLCSDLFICYCARCEENPYNPCDHANEFIDAFRRLSHNGYDLTICGVSNDTIEWLMDDAQCYDTRWINGLTDIISVIRNNVENRDGLQHGKRARARVIV